jgi:hypothetical protein
LAYTATNASIAALYAEGTAELTLAGAKKIANAAEATGIAQDKIAAVLKAVKTGKTLSEAVAEQGLTMATWA